MSIAETPCSRPELALWKEQERIATRELRACTDDDDWRILKYRTDENDAHTQVVRILGSIAELPAVEPAHDTPTRIVTVGEVVQDALKNTFTCGDRVSQRQFQAIQTVMVNFRMFEGSSGTMASTDVLLPIPGEGLGLFGPIQWPVGTGGRGTLAIRARQPERAEHDSRDEILELLQGYPAVGREPALALVTTPFAELAHVVMHGLDERPFPEWVSGEWRQGPYVEGVTRSYTTHFPRYASQGRYTNESLQRMLLAQFAAERGTFTESDLLDFIDTPAPMFLEWCGKDMSMGEGTKPWLRPIEKTSGRRGSVSYTSVVCDNGHPATLVARNPETPRDLLCAQCMTMPEAEAFGMPPGMVYPRAYAEVLHVDLQKCLAELQRKWAGITWENTELKA